MQEITLPLRCDRMAAVAFYPELNDAVSAQTPIFIDGSDVEQIGQAMLQILVAATRNSDDLVIVNPSAEFEDAVRLAKLDEVLDLSKAVS